MNSATPDPLEAFHARRGIVCATGAGGKKTLLYWLARLHPGKVAVTATTFVTHFPAHLCDRIVIAPAAELGATVAGACAQARTLAYALPGNKPGRHGGVPAPLVRQLHAECAFDLTLVKADGARMRWIKAPAADEPVIPAAATTVIPVVSARVLGEPLSERIAHRLERVAAITGAGPGERIEPAHLARLLAHPDGALRGTSGARVVPCINMADTGELVARAHEAATLALAYTDRFDRVVIACLRAGHAPRLEIAERGSTT